MTVKELIEQLRALPPDTPVVVRRDEGYFVVRRIGMIPVNTPCESGQKVGFFGHIGGENTVPAVVFE